MPYMYIAYARLHCIIASYFFSSVGLLYCPCMIKEGPFRWIYQGHWWECSWQGGSISELNETVNSLCSGIVKQQCRKKGSIVVCQQDMLDYIIYYKFTTWEFLKYWGSGNMLKCLFDAWVDDGFPFIKQSNKCAKEVWTAKQSRSHVLIGCIPNWVEKDSVIKLQQEVDEFFSLLQGFTQFCIQIQ